MFSLPQQSSPFSFQTQNFYTPTRPSPLSSSPLRATRSPLSPRDENVSYTFTMSSPPPQFSREQSSVESSARSSASTGKRVVKKNPLIHRDEKDGGRETRRKLFLKRVREESEDKRWHSKGGDDELLRSIYVADRKRSIGRNLRYETGYDETPEDYEIESPAPAVAQQPSLSQPIPRSLQEQMADEVARQEDAELHAYLEAMEAESIAEPQSVPLAQQQHYQHQTAVHIQQSASDEIDYDKMFEDMNMDGAIGQDNSIPDDEDMMDMS